MAISEGIGATVTWSGGTATGFSGKILSIEPPDWEVTLMDTTYLGTSGSFKTNVAASLADPGQVVITAQFDTATTIPALGETGTLLVTFAGASTYTGSATLIGVTPPSPAVDELMTITITFAYDGETGPTETWGV